VQIFSKNKPNKNNYFCAHNTEKLLHGYLYSECKTVVVGANWADENEVFWY